jgi:hypothetical protein
MAWVRQRLVSAPLFHVRESVLQELGALAVSQDFSRKIRPGQTLAIAAGSRNIHRLGETVAACAEFARGLGLSPFLVPAMGSHGGATPEGQTAVLEKLGVLAAVPDIPVRAGMETREIGRLKDGTPVLFSSEALSADHIAVVARVKRHTKFRAPVESGLCKMCAVGLGKASGARLFHQAAVRLGFGIVEEAALLAVAASPFLFGLALVEDGLGQLSSVRAAAPGGFVRTDKELLALSSAMAARIPFDNLDILVVDEIGKDISGIGMDSNVTGRHRDIAGDFSGPPRPGRIFVRALSPGSQGNANGIGLADVCATRAVAAMDREKTYINSLTAISPEKAAIPMHFDTDRECVAACLATSGVARREEARVVRIRNTASLSLMGVSQALDAEARAQESLFFLTGYAPMEFDEKGGLVAFPDVTEARKEG